MKYLSAVLLAMLVGVACAPNPANYHVPQGYKTCSGPMDCPAGTRCGFIGVDTYPVCH
jgi:hypothetical protein